MGIEHLYADRIEEGIQRDLRNPGPPPESSSFSAWSFLKSGAKGPVSGGFESAGSVADVLSGFATPFAASMGDEAARQKMLAGESFDTSAGNVLRRKADEFAPNPETAHKADQVLHGLTRGVSKAVGDIATMGPAAGAVAFGLDEGNTAAQRLRMEGVDTATAAKVGAVTGVLSGVTAGIPGVGPTVKSTLALGLGTGPAAFMAQEALTRDILQRAGRDDLASLHDPTDPLGLALSTILPAAVGGVHIRGLAKRAAAAPGLPVEQLTPAERTKLKFNDPRLDAYAAQAAEANGVPASILLGVKNAGEKSNSDQTSPKGARGVMQFMPATAKEMGLTDPTDPVASINAGAAYLRKLYDAYGSWDAAVAHYNGGGAQAAIVRGGGKPTIPETAAYLERVKKYAAEHAAEKGAADPAVVDAARVRVTDDALMRSMPDHPEARSEVLAASDVLAGGRMPVVDPLEIEGRFSVKLQDHEAAVREYATRPDAEGGKVLNTDVARELSPDYLRDRTQSAAVHEPASGFVKRMYAERLAKLQPGEQVMFTSGGTGSGKTSAINGLGPIRRMKDISSIVYDTNMNTLGSAVQKIEQALDAGAAVRIVHVQRDPVEALVNGALPRAMRQEKEFGTGRTVPLVEHARTHRGAAEVIQQLAERYKDDPRVGISVIDNTHGKGGATVADLGFVRSFDYTGIEGRLHEALNQQHDAGAISEAVRRGTQGDAGARVRSAVRGADGAELERQRLGAGSATSLPADEAVTLKPDTVPAEAPSLDSLRVAQIAEASPDLKVRLPGSDETLTVAAALQRAKEESAHEASEADLVKAAFECALSMGG